MLVDVAQLPKKIVREVDLCILGGGVAGITLANELKDVLGSIAILEAGAEAYADEVQEFYRPEVKPPVYANPHFTRLRMLGGSSNHWENSSLPFDPIDFEKRDWIQNSGWPIAHADLAPYWAKAAGYCGVGTDGYDPEHWARVLKVERPLLPTDSAEMRFGKVAMPPTRFFDRHGGALVASSRVTVFTHANVVDIGFDPVTQRLEKAFFTSNGQVVHEIQARIFVLCLGGIENARMLLYFNARNDNRLGNRYDSVGRYFMDHPTLKPANFLGGAQGEQVRYTQMQETRYIQGYLQLSEATLRRERLANAKYVFLPGTDYQMSDGISSFHVLRENILAGRLPEETWRHLSNMVLDIDMVIEAMARKSFDWRIFDHAESIAGFQVHTMMEQTPSRQNRIVLGRERDALGIPRIQVDWRLEQGDIDMMWRGLMVLGREVGRKSLGRLRLLQEQSSRMFTSQLGFGHHHMGTTRMATTPEQGVVDPDHLVFGTRNLYVGGSSVFVTGGHVTPTLTLTAMTLRLARHLATARGT